MADDKLRAPPAARKLADDMGINLYDVSGSGANGRVHKEDVETYKDTNVSKVIMVTAIGNQPCRLTNSLIR